MKPNYIGTGDPRTEYALRLRGSAYSIGNRNDMSPHFGSMLSDGDKRTLALAFFLAQVTADPVALQGKVLVIDDPVCSLASNRRAQTVALLTRLAGKCAQIIILSHDAYFLRDLHKSLAKKERTLAQATMSINRVGNDYSAFDVCDIDALCASGYYRNHWLLSEYAAGRYTQGLREVAFALRLFLEGYCHRRFPGLLPKECTFGQVIEEVERAAPGTALSGLHARVDELRQLNDYAGRFHHDTNPGNADTAPVTDGELKNYVKRALELVYKG